MNLSHNAINDDQVNQFFNAFISANNKSLKKIWLSKNHITDKGVFAIQKAFMETNCRVTELYLGWNNIWAAGGKAMASILV